MEGQPQRLKEEHVAEPRLGGKKVCPNCGLKLSGTKNTCPADDTPLVPENEAPGDTLWDKYELLGTIGTGGMGIIYKVRLLVINKTFALKMLHAHLAGEEPLRRFQQEGRALSQLSHRNVLGIHDFGVTEHGRPYMVMDYLDGHTLSEALDAANGALDAQLALMYFMQIADGLAHAHKKGILHRDVKPSNVMICQDEDGNALVKILDFGIAKLITDDAQANNLTKTGETLGSPFYMSPEQIMGRPIDRRSDLYSFGCLMYEVLTGAPPFVGQSPIATLTRHLNDEPVPLQQASLGREMLPGLQEIVTRLLAKDPVDRYDSMEEMRSDLVKVAFGQSVEAPPAKPSAQELKAQNERRLQFWSVKALIVGSILTVAISAACISALFLVKGRQPKTDQDSHAKTIEASFAPAVKIAAENAEHAELVRLMCKTGRSFLNLTGADLRDDDLKPLLDYTHAKTIELSKNLDLTDGCLKYLQNNPVEDLDLTQTQVTKLAGLKNLPSLRKLNLNKTWLCDEGCAAIGSLPNLEVLVLNSTPITNQGLKSFYHLQHLHEIDLRGCSQLTPNAVAELHKNLLLCEIKFLDLSQQTDSIWKQAQKHMLSKDFAGAVPYLQQLEFNLAQNGGKHYINTLNMEAANFQSLSKWKQAEACSRRAISESTKAYPASLGESYYTLVNGEVLQSNWPAVEQFCNQALENSSVTGDKKADLLACLGLSYLHQKRYDGVEIAQLAALKQFTTDGIEHANSYRWLADAYAAQGQPALAAKAYDQSLPIYQQLKPLPNDSIVYATFQSGINHAAAHQYPQARQSLRAVIALCAEKPQYQAIRKKATELLERCK